MKYFILLFFYFFCSSFKANCQTSDLDFTFADNGVFVKNVNGGGETGNAIAVQEDGKIVIVYAGASVGFSFDVCVIRLNENGTIDSTFADNGIFKFGNPDQSDIGYGLRLLENGQILVCGSYSQTASNPDFLVFKLNSDGTPDLSFANNGFLILPIDISEDYARSITVNSDNTIIVGGYSYVPGSSEQLNVLCKLSENGVLDPTFGNAGIFKWGQGSSNELYNVEVLGDGSIIVAGKSQPSSKYRPSVYKVFSDGSGLDSSFGINGEYLVPVEGAGYGMKIHKNGKIILSGNSQTANGNDLLVASINMDGTPDLLFGLDGIKIVDKDINDVAYAVVIQEDGKIIASGESGGSFFGGVPRAFFSVRMDETGILDATWGDSGTLKTPTSSIFAFSNASTIQKDGKFLMAGTSAINNNDLTIIRYGYGKNTLVNEPNKSHFTLYPTITKGNLQIKLKEDTFTKYQISDFTGNVFSTGFLNIVEKVNTLSVSELPSGSYTITLFGSHSRESNIFFKY